MNGEKGIYVFCAIRSGEEERFGSVEVEGVKREVFTIHYQDAAMVATEVPMKIYHPKKHNLLMHQQTVSKVMKEHDTVIPISFGNVFQSKEDVEVLLENLYPQFEKLFPAIKGKIELGLKVIAKKEYLEEMVNEHPELVKMSSSVKGKSESAAYYDRIKLGGMAQKLFSSLQEEMKEEIFTPLDEVSEAAKLNEPSSETMLLNAAFLIDRTKEEAFDQLVNEAFEKWEDKVDFHYSGPWPAYNFVNIRLKVEEAG
ncbi:GvpL/GvpF family gas vesicle protein [Rossellomorea aquimaris]|uniref:GvpL/GvpF family gas vesicle protein n=1 Tax=Rossellomorea aquimaris TaxID=189382 RepID=UPI001CD6B194|nr:GvpL/GvpF family gas vesicle protein [Rossellomorea aquimaris]MCA1054997.1 GvpL/GvpF family gas vesicle protein [Rossellomorea aquimaris]